MLHAWKSSIVIIIVWKKVIGGHNKPWDYKSFPKNTFMTTLHNQFQDYSNRLFETHLTWANIITYSNSARMQLTQVFHYWLSTVFHMLGENSQKRCFFLSFNSSKKWLHPFYDCHPLWLNMEPGWNGWGNFISFSRWNSIYIQDLWKTLNFATSFPFLAPAFLNAITPYPSYTLCVLRLICTGTTKSRIFILWLF